MLLLFSLVGVLQFFGSSFASGVQIRRRKSSEPSPQYAKQLELCGIMFDSWSQSEQVHFVQSLLLRMCHQQHGQIDAFLKPMLQRDFISSLPGLLIWLRETQLYRIPHVMYINYFFSSV